MGINCKIVYNIRFSNNLLYKYKLCDLDNIWRNENRQEFGKKENFKIKNYIGSDSKAEMKKMF